MTDEVIDGPVEAPEESDLVKKVKAAIGVMCGEFSEALKKCESAVGDKVVTAIISRQPEGAQMPGMNNFALSIMFASAVDGAREILEKKYGDPYVDGDGKKVTIQ